MHLYSRFSKGFYHSLNVEHKSDILNIILHGTYYKNTLKKKQNIKKNAPYNNQTKIRHM